MTSQTPVEFPRVNLISILAGSVCLISVFLSWWGVTGSGSGFSGPASWSLWSFPTQTGSTGFLAQFNEIMSWAGIFMLAIVLITSALVLLGSFPAPNRYLKAGFALAIGTVFAYAGIVSYAVASACQSSANCISGPFGSETTTNGTLSWGFHSGFYLFLVGAFFTLGAIVSHRAFLREQTPIVPTSPPVIVSPAPVILTPPPTKTCPDCGTKVLEEAKFCPNCGASMTKPRTTPPTTTS